MKVKQFFGKLLSRYLWLNLGAMAAVVVVLCLGVKFGLDVYTHHGEAIPIPSVVRMDFDEAKRMLEGDGLLVVVTDSGYNKTMPTNCILAQNPDAGTRVKAGHIVYVTVNSPSSPTLSLPDIIENSSSRDATAKLQSMGFRVIATEYVTGEKDWVYGVKYRGRSLNTGSLIPSDAALTLVVGNGQYEEEDVNVDYSAPEDEIVEEGGGEETDPFEEVPEQ